MTSLETARVIGQVLLASPLVMVYFAAWIVCQPSASLNWMSRASPCRRVSFSCRACVGCRACVVCLLTVRRPSHGCLYARYLCSARDDRVSCIQHGCLSRVLCQAGCHARHLVDCRTTSCVLQD